MDEAGEPLDVARPMQVLAVEKRQRNVKTYDVAEDPPEDGATASVQEYERWMSFGAEPCGVPTTMEIFTLGGPRDVNLLALSGTDEGARGKFVQWDVQPSDVQGCMALVNPRGLQASHQLTDPNVPYLALIDALHHAGFLSTRGVVEHKKVERTHMYDGRVRHKDYLRCVLLQTHLFDAGCDWFDSRGPAAFYALLLRWPQKAVPGLSARACMDLLGRAPGPDGVRSAVLDSCAAPPPPVPPQRARSGAGLAGPSSGGVGGPPPPPPAAPSDSPAQSHASSSCSSSSSSSSSSESGLAGSSSDDSTAAPPDDPYPRKLFGQVVRREEHVRNGQRFVGLRVACLNPAHCDVKKCSRYRSLAMDVDKYGVQAPIFHLGCWLLHSHDKANRNDHMRWRPNQADMDAYLSLYGPSSD